MSSANDIQHGGDHYKGAEYQHWDWVSEIGMEYVPAVATKYISRWRKKDGKLDLQKAEHYIQKAEELGLAGADNASLDKLWRFTVENNLTATEAAACYYVMRGSWELAREAIAALLGSS